ncbi:MAG: CoA pyrophosphatase [Nonlabens sp.]
MISFIDLQDRFPKLRQCSLPGQEAQLEMAAVQRIKELTDVNRLNKKYKKASVVMLVYPKKEENYFVLIKRVTSTGKHSGQIAFPGGRRESIDQDNMTTAIRELKEEIGVEIDRNNVLQAGTPLYIPPSNYMVYPFLAFAKAEPKFIAQESEVAGIIEVPLSSLLNPESITTTTISNNYMENLQVPSFMFEEVVVWGATAMMLNEFKHLFLKVLQ